MSEAAASRASVEPATAVAGSTVGGASDRHFGTDHLLTDVKRRSVRGGAVTLAAQSTKFVLQLASTAVLARLLTPADFGLFAMVAALTGFATLFRDLGLSDATIQRSEITHQEVSTLFWINVATSTLLAVAVVGLAPFVGWLYGEPRLIAITTVVAGTLVLGGLTAQHTALLRRHMRFTALAVIEVLAMAGGVGVAIAMALAGFGYWALVGMAVATAAMNVALVWPVSGWRPGGPSRARGVWPMLKFGGNLTGFNLMNYFTIRLQDVLIGWYWGASSLGLYSKAYNLLLMPLRQIAVPLNSVALPTLCRLQDDPERYRSYYRKALLPIVGLSMPVVAFTFVFADALILTVMGSQWGAAIAIYRVLAVVAFIDTWVFAIGWVFVSLGQTDRQFRWQILESAVTVVAVGIGLPWGPVGVATGFCIARVAMRPPVIFYCFRYAPVSVHDLSSVIWRPAAASLAAGVATWIIFSIGSVDLGDALTLLLGFACYILLYTALSWVLPGGRAALRMLPEMLAELRRKSNDISPDRRS